MVEKDFPGEEGNEERQEIEQQVYPGIKQRFVGSRFFAHCFFVVMQDTSSPICDVGHVASYS